MITYKLHKSHQVIEINYKGDIYLQELLDFINSMIAKCDLPYKLKSITSATEANFKFLYSELEPIVEAMSCLSKRIDSLKEAFIINSPQAMVLATTFKIMNSKSENYRMEIFSTKEAALRWQGIDYF
ncbi:MAG: hypothetical protein IH595_13090 [Bacteroidales bacterium]|nr:hypothetical protein [Bacteroidales bacterium]